MSQFEFVTILYSLVVAFGISELLAAVGRILRDRARIPPFPPQILLLCLILLALLQSLWGYWGFRETVWTFWRFLIAFLPLLALTITTSVAIPQAVPEAIPEANPEASPAKGETRAKQYFSSARLVFPLLAATVVLGAVAELALVAPDWHLGQLVRIAFVGVLLALARSESTAAHTVGLLIMGVLQLVFIGVVTPALG